MMDVRWNLDLSKIYRAPIFQTRSARDAQYQLSRQLVDHGLRWFPGEVSASLYRRELNRISLMILQYGTEVEVSPLTFEDFTLVQMPLKGAVQIESAGTCIRVVPGEVAVVPRGCPVRLLWEPGCEQLILRLPDSLLADAGDTPHGVASLAGARLPSGLAAGVHWCQERTREAPGSHRGMAVPLAGSSKPNWTDSVYKIRADLIDPWIGMLQQAVSLLPAGNTHLLHPAWLNQFEQTLAGFVYAHQPTVLKAAERFDDGGPDEVTPGYRAGQCSQLDRLEDYIRSRLFAPLSLADLARAAGVTARTLNVVCHRHRGVAPMTLVRNLRLDAARQRLLSGLPVSITEVAMEYGFGHLGRFSAYYRERFGELPKQTGRALKEAQCAQSPQLDSRRLAAMAS
ncbi:AraC family transcriptional regulator [Bordetella muralis]|uniref:AraC family transcriptional regulator n=1 Tax=Bordetella muralis TaxID=1649130 RepID=UPI0039EE8277